MRFVEWQERYKLKKTYINGIPANQIRMTSPVSSMNDAQWCELVKICSSAKNKVCEPIDFLSTLAMVYLCYSLTQMKLQETSEKNKRNYVKLKYHQATGSRSYIIQM